MHFKSFLIVHSYLCLLQKKQTAALGGLRYDHRYPCRGRECPNLRFHSGVVFRVYSVAVRRTFAMQKHRLQLSRNLWDSPGFVDFVPGPGGPSYLSRKFTD